MDAPEANFDHARNTGYAERIHTLAHAHPPLDTGSTISISLSSDGRR